MHIGAGEVRFIEARTLQESAYFTDRPSMTRYFSAGKGVTTLPRLQELEGPPFLPVLFFLLVFFAKTFFVVGHLVELGGYSLLFINLMLVLNK